ncbi:GGDEF domain-containing protein [Cetobacterium somerae]|uniref:GGDEF domain-containing protein n=1 Tax=Cetobacterium sp. NK01 TaxID=2993530 RepID=UPI002115EA40|nr:GGDEF domain-containing protein [Cetobacterium sp. NK01]MCQ8212079.1 GGDEF domain-containing protein [Cetobacterium sp. NK01]
MKKKSYNIFVILSMTFLTFSLIFFLVIRNKKEKEREASFLNKITLYTNYVDFNNLTPLEKKVLDEFNKIPKSEYPHRYKEIAENNRVLLNSISERNLGAFILKQLLNSDNLSPEARLYLLNKLRVLDASSGNIANAIKITMDYYNLAEELNSQYDIARAKIALGAIFSSLGGYETSIKILTEINLEDKEFPEILRLKTSLYLYLAENYYFLKEYDNALDALDSIPNLNSEPIDYQKNVVVLKELINARIYTELNNPKIVKASIDKANFELNNLTKIYFTDLKTFHMIALQGYYLRYDTQHFSPTVLEDFIEKAKLNGDIVFLKLAFKQLFNYYFEIKDFDRYRKLSIDYETYLDKINFTNNKVFSLYLIENIEHERFARENERLYRNIALLFLAIFVILGVSYKRSQYLSKKAKIDALTDIGNRLAFNNDINSLKNEKYSMLLFDIDNFKRINDKFGHDFGDEVLITIGKILKTIENKEITIYRVGGEEFAIIFTHLNEAFAMESCEYIRKSVENIHWKHHITVTISGGFSKATKNTYVECDKRLYKAKSSGKNMIIYQDINEGDLK